MTDGWIDQIREVVGADYVLTDPMDLLAYSEDAYTLYRANPRAVVLPTSTDQVRRVVSILSTHNIPFLPRGAGTSLSGGATPLENSVIIHLSRMNRIVEIDVNNQIAVVEPGVINQAITKAVSPLGYFYAPDPSSQQSCTIGGNFAENSGGPHCLKYGVTLNHVVMAEVILANGEKTILGNLAGEPDDVDWLGVMIGSEGTFGIATKLWIKLTPRPRSTETVLALFDDITEASQAVSDIVAQGIIPAALEMMDTLAIKAVELGP